jgi:hypothetical protein
VPESGLGTSEVGKEIADHAHHQPHDAPEAAAADRPHRERREWVMAVVEASLLALVAVLAAWSGYSSAKWGTESRLVLAKASTLRTQASTAELQAMTQRNFDSSTFTVWFVAYVAGDAQKMAVAERRFTPNFRRAFEAWWATDPATNPHAPPGPTYMPQYRQPQAAQADALNARATALYAKGATDGSNSDDYVRLTVYLATVLFLIAISGQFKIHGVRIALIVVGGAVLVFALIQLSALPFPPR